MMRESDPFQGRSVIIENILIDVSDDSLQMRIVFYVENEEIKVLFHNVSRLSVCELSFPAVISGVEIVDNSNRGWESDARYYIHDYEDDKISFYCQSWNVSENGT